MWILVTISIYFSAKECDVLHGECVQTYVPYLFLVIPLGKIRIGEKIPNSKKIQCYSL